MKTKVCSKCKQKKRISDFPQNKKYTDGLYCWCKVCTRKYRTKYARKWRKENPDKVEAAELRRRQQPGYKEKNRKHKLKYTYDLTLEEYNKMFQEQQGRCAICGKHQTELRSNLHIDHCHKTGKVRKLLCNNCNSFVGWLEKYIDNDLLENCLKYLKDN